MLLHNYIKEITTDDYVIKNIYNIYSYKDAINYIKNNKELNINTKKRIIEAISHLYIETVFCFDV